MIKMNKRYQESTSRGWEQQKLHQLIFDKWNAKAESSTDKKQSISNLGNKGAIELLFREVKNLKKLLLGDDPAVIEEIAASGNLHSKMKILEVRLKQVMDQIVSLDRLCAEQVENLFGQCAGLEDAVALLERRINENTANQNYPIVALNERCAAIEEEIEKLTSLQQKVLDGEADRDMQISACIEQLEFVKICKIDREEFIKELEKKLDAEEINRKVSQDKFIATCDDLKLNLDETIEKLATQEEMWQRALVDVQSEIVTKLEKTEMIALQQFVKEKVRILQEKVKAMKIVQKEQEAAATKQKLLKKLQCLSCDADVGMRTHQTPEDYPRSPTLPPTKTIAPYLAYELDAMRKQQRGSAASRNMHHFEAIIQNKGDRVENRYCGGPHTLTTPVQRVTRVGHFLEQWGPELTTAGDQLIKGSDGNIYLGCELEKPLPKRKAKPSMIVEGDILQDRDIPEKDGSTQRTPTRFKKQEAKESLTVSRSKDSVRTSKTKLKSVDIQEPQKSSEVLNPEKNGEIPETKKSLEPTESKKASEILDPKKSGENLDPKSNKKVSAFSFDENPEKFPYL